MASRPRPSLAFSYNANCLLLGPKYIVVIYCSQIHSTDSACEILLKTYFHCSPRIISLQSPSILTMNLESKMIILWFNRLQFITGSGLSSFHSFLNKLMIGIAMVIWHLSYAMPPTQDPWRKYQLIVTFVISVCVFYHFFRKVILYCI